MELQSVLDLRDEVLGAYYRDELNFGGDGGLRVTAAPVPRYPEQRLAIGARWRGPGDYAVAIRVQRESGRAMNRARRLIASLADETEADLAVIRARVPSRTAVAATAGATAPGAGFCRPLRLGYSIGHLDGAPGTLGLFAEHRSRGTVALSNNHVLALANTADVGDAIYQAGIPDGQPDAENRIGTLGNYRALRRAGSNRFDAAYCVLNGAVDTVGNRVPEEFAAADSGQPFAAPVDLDALSALVTAIGAGASVAKIGRTTGYTAVAVNHVVFGINDVIVDVPGLGNCRFDDLIEVEALDAATPFTDLGDSGAICYLEGARAPFGLLFASGTTTRTGVERAVSYACALKPVFEAYNLESL